MTDTADRDEFPVPPRFGTWPQANRVDYLELSVTRADLLALLRGFLGVDRSGERVSKHELALIIDLLEVWR
ncbi:hypothetical protein EGH24_13940 [Halonotius terrestris]|uniref:Uncharacterized protein n=1 Tax=Halonotius terrestris TaxID=2487750 RepID=A0A8J8P9M3_9EURY|nr:hypothetical protein [Halonotius terrestris]TQQ78619.1 hypothetical protein EGH24_13940 [Halonotius terrestris]